MRFLFTVVIFSLSVSASASSQASSESVKLSVLDRHESLRVYVHDSFLTKKGFGRWLQKAFKEKTGVKLKMISYGDGAQLVTRLQMDKRRSKFPQVVIGVDQYLWPKVQKWVASWKDWKPVGWQQLVPAVQEVIPSQDFLPYDYSHFCFMADTVVFAQKKLALPKSFKSLLTTPYKKMWILQDPRTSTPGLGFLVATKVVFKDKLWDFWKKARHHWRSITSGWKDSYGLFMKQQAPLVWSYVTSEAYHTQQKPGQKRYRALLFEEGQPIQVEGAFLVKQGLKSKDQRRQAMAFLEFLLSKKAQEALPTRNWMFPVRKMVSLPKSFQRLPVVSKTLTYQPSAAQLQKWWKRWPKAIRGR